MRTWSYVLPLVALCSVTFLYLRSSEPELNEDSIRSEALTQLSTTSSELFVPALTPSMTYSKSSLHEYTQPNINHMKVIDLKKSLRKLGLSDVGVKPQLRERLRVALHGEPREISTKREQLNQSRDLSTTKHCNINFSSTVAIMLEPWTVSGITQSMLDEVYCIRKQVARVSIVDGKLRQENWQLTMDHSRLRATFWLLRQVIERASVRGEPLPDVEFIVNPTDKSARFASGRQQKSTDGDRLRSAPLFCNVKCVGDHGISYPIDYQHLYGLPDGQMSTELYEKRRTGLIQIGTSLTWDEKATKLFFSATNVRGHRASLLGFQSPHLTTVRAKVPLKQYGGYQYSVYTYGHSGWSRRLRELAHFNTTVFMEASSCQEYFFHSFQAGEHYIEVAEDLSDLSDKLALAISQPTKSQLMAARWVAMGTELMSLDCILSYMDSVLRKYASLQRFKPRERDDLPQFTDVSGSEYFLDSHPPDVALCRPFY